MKKLGIILVELLVVVAIVAILAAITFSVMASAKTRSKNAVAMSNLRQLGQAAAMYSETSGSWPFSPDQLVQAGLAPKSICISPIDITPDGAANTVYKQLWSNSEQSKGGYTSYRQSFVSAATYNYTPLHLQFIEKSPAAGWLVDLCPSTRRIEQSWLWLDGTYHRLLYDTAVITRKHSDFNDNGEQSFGFIFMFADFSNDDKLKYVRGTWRSGL